MASALHFLTPSPFRLLVTGGIDVHFSWPPFPNPEHHPVLLIFKLLLLKVFSNPYAGSSPVSVLTSLSAPVQSCGLPGQSLLRAIGTPVKCEPDQHSIACIQILFPPLKLFSSTLGILGISILNIQTCHKNVPELGLFPPSGFLSLESEHVSARQPSLSMPCLLSASQ